MDYYLVLEYYNISLNHNWNIGVFIKWKFLLAFFYRFQQIIRVKRWSTWSINEWFISLMNGFNILNVFFLVLIVNKNFWTFDSSTVVLYNLHLITILIKYLFFIQFNSIIFRFAVYSVTKNIEKFRQRQHVTSHVFFLTSRAWWKVSTNPYKKHTL